MASSTAAIKLGARAYSAPGAKASSGIAAVYAGAQASGDPFANSGEISDSTPGNLKSWLPPQRVALAYVDIGGQRMPVYIDASTWYRFFQFVAEIKLGGVNGPTLANVATDVITGKAQTAAVVAQTAAITQQVQTNAEALVAVVEVTQQNDLSGSAQIPPVVTRAPTNYAIEIDLSGGGD